MSDEIQAISQGNYILHNIDAKKLYVQEPLFTANSGDAVYVGWRPDETVLWSGAMASAANLSEPMTAFDYVKVYYADDFTDTGKYHTVAQLDPNNGSHMWQPIGGLGEAGCWLGITYMSANNDYSILSVPKVKLVKFGTWDATATGANAITTVTTGKNVEVLYKVVGCNRKENA